MPVDVKALSCPPEEAAKHLRAFAESFIAKNHIDRWIHILLEKPEKAEDYLHKFEHQLNEKYCKELGGAESFPASLSESYKSKRGVYFDGSEPPSLMTAAEAASISTEKFADAVISIVPGKLALFFHHDGWTWICER